MNYEVLNAKNEHGKEIILNLMQLYLLELSSYEGETAKFIKSDNGLFEINIQTYTGKKITDIHIY